MTEDEAKTCWCPFARMPVFATELRDIQSAGTHETARIHKLVVAANRAESHRPLTLCIGSACMAWRWEGERRETHGRPYIEAIKAYRDRHGSDLKTARDAVDATWTAPSPTMGFCGLAGDAR